MIAHTVLHHTKPLYRHGDAAHPTSRRKAKMTNVVVSNDVNFTLGSMAFSYYPGYYVPDTEVSIPST